MFFAVSVLPLQQCVPGMYMSMGRNGRACLEAIACSCDQALFLRYWILDTAVWRSIQHAVRYNNMACDTACSDCNVYSSQFALYGWRSVSFLFPGGFVVCVCVCVFFAVPCCCWTSTNVVTRKQCYKTRWITRHRCQRRGQQPWPCFVVLPRIPISTVAEWTLL